MRSVHKTEEGGEEATKARPPRRRSARPASVAAHLKGTPNTNATVPWGRCHHRFELVFCTRGQSHLRHLTSAAVGKRGSPLRAVVSVSEILGLVVAQASERGRERGRGRREQGRTDGRAREGALARPRPPLQACSLPPLPLFQTCSKFRNISLRDTQFRNRRFGVPFLSLLQPLLNPRIYTKPAVRRLPNTEGFDL